MSRVFCCTSNHLLEVNLAKYYIVEGDSQVIMMLEAHVGFVGVSYSQLF